MSEILALNADSPFDFHSVRTSHGWHRLLPFHDDESGVLGYSLQLAGGPVVGLTLSAAPNGVRVVVEPGWRLDGEQRREILGAVRWMCGLDLDLRPFYEAAAEVPQLRHVVEQRAGRLLRSPTVFEDVVKTMLTTNTTWAQTKAMNRRMVEALGPRGPAGGQAFPSAAVLAAADDGTWRNLRLGYRAAYIRELAERVAAGELDLEGLKTREMETDALVKELKRIKGVGDYAAAIIAGILGRYDRIGVDSIARVMVSRYFYGGQPVTPAQIRAPFERFGRYRFLAYWFWNFDLEGDAEGD